MHGQCESPVAASHRGKKRAVARRPALYCRRAVTPSQAASAAPAALRTTLRCTRARLPARPGAACKVGELASSRGRNILPVWLASLPLLLAALNAAA